VRQCDTPPLQLGVTDVRFDARDQVRRYLANTVLLGVLSRFLEYFLFRLAAYDMLTPTRRIYLSAFYDLCHEFASLFHMIH
jgi:heme/copper-type cytochrome/quinol oxidase subunit 3